MRYKILLRVLPFLLLAPFFFMQIASADAPPKDPAAALKLLGKKAEFETERADLNTIIGGSIKAFLSLLGVIFLGLLIYGGYTWMTAQGEEEGVTKAKKIITQAVIGIVIVMASYAATTFVLTVLEAQTLGTTTP